MILGGEKKDRKKQPQPRHAAILLVAACGTFVVGVPQRGHHGHDRVGARGSAAVQPRRKVRQALRLPEPLVEQAQVGQQGRARGNAVDARDPAVWTTTSTPKK